MVRKWPPDPAFATPKQKWWVTFWSTKESMKAGMYANVEWQLKSLLKQLEELKNDHATKASVSGVGSKEDVLGQADYAGGHGLPGGRP